jgi:hypothetical protein
MANTRVLTVDVENFVRYQLELEYGQPFTKKKLRLNGCEGSHEFDAVSSDQKIVASVKSSTGRTSGNKNPSGKIAAAVAEMYFLSLVDTTKRLLVLTNLEFFEILTNTMMSRLGHGIEIIYYEMPEALGILAGESHAGASLEISAVISERIAKSPIQAQMVQHSMESSLRRLYESDHVLIEEDANERSMVNRLSTYLTPIVESWGKHYQVEVEYNRMGELVRVPKRLIGIGNVLPDLIVHRRGRSGPTNNLLIVEVKKSPTRQERRNDLAKLRAYLEDEPLNYQYGLYLELQKKAPKWIWFGTPNLNENSLERVW